MRKTILFFTVFICSLSEAQENNPWRLSEVLDNNNGLLQNSIGSIYFDNKTGFLWMTTESGLVRYDGVDAFVFDKRLLPGMETVRMSVIFPTLKDGILAMDRNGGIYKIDGAGVKKCRDDSIGNPSFLNIPFKGSFYNVKFANEIMNNLVVEGKGAGGKYDLSQLPLSILWINDSTWVSYSSKAFKIFKNTKEIAEWEKQASEQPVLIRYGTSVYALNENGSGYKIDPAGMTCSRINASGDAFLKGTPVLYYDRLNNQPLLLNGEKLFRIEFSGNSVSAKFLADLPNLPENISSILVHPSGRIIFAGSQLSGLYIYAKSSFRTYKATGTTQIIGRVYAARNNVYATVLPSQDHALTSTSVLFNLKSGTYSILPYTIERQNAVLLDKAGNLWYAYSDTLFRIRSGSSVPDKKILITLRENTSGEGLNFLNALYQSASGRIWVSTQEYLGYIENNEVKVYMPFAAKPDEGIISFTYMTETAEGELLGSNAFGLYYLDTIKRKAVPFQQVTAKSIRSVYADSAGYCWIATYGNGLFLFDLNKKKFSRLPVDRNGYLLFGHVFCDDGRGNFLVPSNRGLFRINRAHLIEAADKPGTNLFYQYFDINSGLESNEFNGGCIPAFNRLNNGDLLLPSLRGLVRVIVNELPDPGRYPLFIDRVETKNKVYEKMLTMPGFSASERNQVWHISFAQWDQGYSPGFSYKLDGDTEWIHLPDGERKIQLTDLAGGNHVLNIRFQSGFSPDRISSLIIPFYVNKKYYEQTWFWGFSFLALLILIYIAVRLQTRGLSRKNVVLERKVNEKTKELVERNKDLANTLFHLENTIQELNAAMSDLQRSNLFKSRLIGVLGHDVLIPLQYIAKVSGQLKLYKEKLSTETTLESLGEISSTAFQLEFFGESIIHWIKLQNNEYKPVVEKFRLNKIINDLTGFHQLLLGEKGNNVSNEVPPELYFTQDSTLVKIILHNLLMNANKFTSNGVINISAGIEDSWLVIRIKDNGRGMDKDKVTALNNLQPIISSMGTNMESGWGMGYIIIIDLMKFSKGTMFVESRENEGTSVTLKLPPMKQPDAR